MFLITAGISFKNYENTKKEVLEQIEEMKNGRFSIKDIKAAKEVIISVINEINDSPWAIIEYYTNYLYFNTDTIEKQINEIKRITKEDVIKISKKIDIDTIFLLKEDQNEEISN